MLGACLLGLCAAQAIAAQSVPAARSSADTLWVGSPAVVGRRLMPYTNLWNLIFVDSAGKTHQSGTVSDDLSFPAGRGGVAVRTQVQHAPNGVTVITRNEFDRATMAPISRDFSISNNRHVEVRFDSTVAAGSVADSSGRRPFRFVLPRRVFDFEGGMYGLLLRGLPLAVGYSTTMATLGEVIDSSAGMDRVLHYVAVRVPRRERVAAGAGRMVDTWRVEATTHDFGTLIFWLADEPPYIIRAQAPISGGLATYAMP